MLDIMMVLGSVSQCLDATTLRRLTRITEAMLSMTGRVTMLGLSRWTGPGGSYRNAFSVVVSTGVGCNGR